MLRAVLNMAIIIAIILFMKLGVQILYSHDQNTVSNRNSNRNHHGHSTKRTVLKINNFRLHDVTIQISKKRNSNY